MAKYTLSASDDDLDFAAIGISCAVEQYQAVELVDAALGIALQLANYVPYTLKANKVFLFSLYQYVDEGLGLEYSFVPNLSNFEHAAPTESNDLFAEVEVEERLRLIKELPKTDYFLLVKGESLMHYSSIIADRLRQNSSIIQVNSIDLADLPSKRNLFF